MATKYIFVSGGVTSSLGKGIIAASLAKLLQARKFRVTIQKFDPYINIDPGTLNPYEHGECYVTEDGAETDLDLGHYERFLNVHTSKANNVTTGKIYKTVIDKEREGAYLGKTVQIIPHITDEIKRRMLLLGKSGKYDIIITELGGTVGDIESTPFIEAVRQLQWELPDEDCILIHLTLVPFLSAAKELKTKPTQHSVQKLREEGVYPDVLLCRADRPIPDEERAKIALFANLPVDHVVGTDNTAYPAVDVLRDGGEVEVEPEFGLLQIAGEVEHGPHGYGRAVEIGFGGKTFVKVFEVGREGIVGFDVEPGILRGAREGDAAAGFYDKVLGDEVLQAEIVISLVDGVGAIQFHVGEGVVFEPYVAAACGVYHVAGCGVHEQVHRHLRIDVDLQVERK